MKMSRQLSAYLLAAWGLAPGRLLIVIKEKGQWLLRAASHDQPIFIQAQSVHAQHHLVSWVGRGFEFKPIPHQALRQGFQAGQVIQQIKITACQT
jgi:hypothetical protein